MCVTLKFYTLLVQYCGFTRMAKIIKLYSKFYKAVNIMLDIAQSNEEKNTGIRFH